MKRIIIILFSLLMFVNAANAHSNYEVPAQFNITEHWVSLTTSFDIGTRTHKIGTLYRKFLSFFLTYEFYDSYDNKMATSRARFLSLTAHFDIFDTNEKLIGMADERMFSFFPTFDIYADDASTKVANAVMNFWGTNFTIYDPLTGQEMAQMRRSFFRLKNDWRIKITDRALFERKNIDFRVLMTVLAFQGDRENWERDLDNNSNTRNSLHSADAALQIPDDELLKLQKKIAAVTITEELSTIPLPSKQSLEKIAMQLENDYKKTQDKEDLSVLEKLNSFIEYSLNLVASNDVSSTKKKAILYLLRMRLNGVI